MAISKFNAINKSVLSKLGGISIIAPSITYIINEDFEGTGPGAWFNSGADFDSVTSPLAGAQSLRLDFGDYVVSPTINESEVYLKFRIRLSALPGSLTSFVSLENAAFTYETQIVISPTGTIIVYGNTGGTGFVETIGVITAGVAYDMRFYSLKGTGANGVHSIGFVEAGGIIPTSGNNYVSSVTGVEDANVDHILFIGGASGVTVDFDNIQLARTLIP